MHELYIVEYHIFDSKNRCRRNSILGVFDSVEKMEEQKLLSIDKHEKSLTKRQKNLKIKFSVTKVNHLW